MTRNRKLLIFSDWYLPAVKAGGPVRSVSAIAESLKESFEVYILTTDRDLNSSAPYDGVSIDVWQQLDGINIKYISPNKKRETIRAELNREWDAVYLNSLFSLYFTILPLLIGRGRRGNFVLAPRGMFGGGALKLKSIKKKIFFFLSKLTGLYRNVLWQASSEKEQTQILKVFPGGAVRVVPNLSSIKRREYVFQDFEPNQKLKLITVARIAEVKNLEFILGVLAKTEIKYSLDIYGPIEDDEYWLKCKHIIKFYALNVNYIGELENEEVLQVLQNYHIFVLPTLGENFGHSILESFAASLPVLISDQTPWVNLEAQKSGKELPLNYPDLWLKWLIKFYEMDNEEYQEWRKGAWELAQKKLDQKELVLDYVKMFS